MTETLTSAIALVFVIEGLAYILFPDQMKRFMSQILSMSSQNLRTAGLVMAVFGLLWLWFIQSF